MSDNKDIKLVIAQLNFFVGHIPFNRDLINDAYKKALAQKADVIVFPELALTGYPPEDLIYRNDFYEKCEAALNQICEQTEQTVLVLGTIKRDGDKLYNSAIVMQYGKIIAQYNKQALPNYSVFDEMRYFTSGDKPLVIDIAGVPTSINICEDVWVEQHIEQAVAEGAKWVLNLNASPFHINKHVERIEVISAHCNKHQIPVVYANLVGGQDELVFDGASFVIDGNGQCQYQAAMFEEELGEIRFNWDGQRVAMDTQARSAVYDEVEQVYKTLVLGVRDYINKNNFQGAVLGLSGGIDSALTLAIAVDAIGAEKVEAVLLPSCYTAQMSNDDAIAECQNLDVEYHIIPIAPAVDVFAEMLKDEFAGLPVDTTEENIQARIRGLTIMAISNKKHRIVLTTGNKSEMAVGYATLYGDMAGGYAVLKDVSKQLVYALSNFCNRNGEVIPQRVIDRPPSAELAPDQKDTDSLPDYEILDSILEAYVENDQSIAEIVSQGFDEQIVTKVVTMVDRNEYKRRQAAPGVRISKRAFSRDRRYPITSGMKQTREQ